MFLLHMANTLSNILPEHFTAPPFWLKDTTSSFYYSFNDLKGEKGTLVLFICNHCPFVVYALPEIVKIANDYRVQGISVIAISSNDIDRYPQDGPELMTQFAFDNKMDFAYLFDETQEVAKAYNAACTPDFYLFDALDTLVYHGQLDDSRPGNNIPLSGTDLRTAIDAILYNRTIPHPQKQSMGCGIKWK